jgi:hypothetical protein
MRAIDASRNGPRQRAGTPFNPLISPENLRCCDGSGGMVSELWYGAAWMWRAARSGSGVPSGAKPENTADETSAAGVIGISENRERAIIRGLHPPTSKGAMKTDRCERRRFYFG